MIATQKNGAAAARVQPLGGKSDAERLCAALHCEQRATLDELSGRQHRARRDLVVALEAIGGAITLNYGLVNAMWAIATAKYGVDLDLLTCEAGFGHMGLTITSL